MLGCGSAPSLGWVLPAFAVGKQLKVSPLLPEVSPEHPSPCRGSCRVQLPLSEGEETLSKSGAPSAFSWHTGAARAPRKCLMMGFLHLSAYAH